MSFGELSNFFFTAATNKSFTIFQFVVNLGRVNTNTNANIKHHP